MSTIRNKNKEIQTVSESPRQRSKQQLLKLMSMVELSSNSLADLIQKEVDENLGLEVVYDDEVSPDNDAGESSEFEEFDDDGTPRDLTASRDENAVMEDGYHPDDDDIPVSRDYNGVNRQQNADDSFDSQDRSLVYTQYVSPIESLNRQLDEMELPESDLALAHYIVNSLDDNGYLRENLRNVAVYAGENLDMSVTKDDVERVLTTYVQSLDPAGTGARDLRECLLLQLQQYECPLEEKEVAIRIMNEAFEPFMNKHFDTVVRVLSISENQLNQAYGLIRKMNPCPIDKSTTFEKNGLYINPDFIIRNENGELKLTLNKIGVPNVQVSEDYLSYYESLQNREMADKIRKQSLKFLRENVDKANQFISLLKTRDVILFNTMYAIMQHQESFFKTGDTSQLRPMILKTIADEINVDIATVSRVSNSKYVQTDFGVISLKSLFSESVNDEEVSSNAVKSTLSDIISKENKRKPLSDEKLCALLKESGYDVARRTVAKYRDQLNIPVARLRREIPN